MVRLPSDICDQQTHCNETGKLTVVGDDFDTVVLPDSNAANGRQLVHAQCRYDVRVGGSEINANGTFVQIFGHVFCSGWWWVKDKRVWLEKKIDW